MTFLYKPPERDRKIRSVQRPIPNPKKSNALEHLTNGWMPFNPELLKTILEKYDDDAYGDDPKLVLNDIKSDPALTLHCVKHASALLNNRQARENPWKTLQSAEVKDLYHILTFPPEQFSIHQFKQTSTLQARRLQMTLLSSNAAQKIAGKFKIDPDVAFTSALFRQLGLQLIAWNYPSIYGRILSNQKRQQLNVDFELKKILGISPSQLGQKFAADWGLCPDFVRALYEDVDSNSLDDDAGNQSIPGQGMTVAKLCEMTELFARSRDPESYPSAEALWRTREAGIKQIIGVETLETVEQSVRDTLMIVSHAADSMRTLPIVDLQSKYYLKKHHGPSLMKKNSYLEDCPEHVVKLFREFYEQLEDTRVSLNALRLLAEEIVPLSGFVRGCVFLQDEEKYILKPSIRFGDVRLEEYFAILHDAQIGVDEALLSTAPIKQTWRGVTGATVVQLCGSLRNYAHPGVLYLEILTQALDDESFDPLISFHTIRQAINHCFGSDR